MKKQIRYGVFETNSSSVHSLTIVSKEEFERFKNGEMVLDRWGERLVEVPTKTETDGEEDNYEYDKYETYDNLGGGEYETFIQNYKTKNGDEIVAFGFYGHD